MTGVVLLFNINYNKYKVNWRCKHMQTISCQKSNHGSIEYTRKEHNLKCNDFLPNVKCGAGWLISLTRAFNYYYTTIITRPLTVKLHFNHNSLNCSILLKRLLRTIKQVRNFLAFVLIGNLCLNYNRGKVYSYHHICLRSF